MRLINFFMEGGWSMWFVLLFGTITLVAAAGYARRPRTGADVLVTLFQRATVCSIAAGVSLNIATVGSQIPARPELADNPRVHLIVMQGIAESLAPAILGFSLLTLVWIVMAVGQRQLSYAAPR